MGKSWEQALFTMTYSDHAILGELSCTPSSSPITSLETSLAPSPCVCVCLYVYVCV